MKAAWHEVARTTVLTRWLRTSSSLSVEPIVEMTSLSSAFSSRLVVSAVCNSPFSLRSASRLSGILFPSTSEPDKVDLSTWGCAKDMLTSYKIHTCEIHISVHYDSSVPVSDEMMYKMSLLHLLRIQHMYDLSMYPLYILLTHPSSVYKQTFTIRHTCS